MITEFLDRCFEGFDEITYTVRASGRKVAKNLAFEIVVKDRVDRYRIMEYVYYNPEYDTFYILFLGKWFVTDERRFILSILSCCLIPF